MSKAKMSVTERFWSYADKGPGCWRWTGATRSGGYGVYRFGSRSIAAHRLAWELTYGPIPPPQPGPDGAVRVWVITHTCGNKRCIRPEHLRLVSPAAEPGDTPSPLPASARASEPLPRQPQAAAGTADRPLVPALATPVAVAKVQLNRFWELAEDFAAWYAAAVVEFHACRRHVELLAGQARQRHAGDDPTLALGLFEAGQAPEPTMSGPYCVVTTHHDSVGANAPLERRPQALVPEE